MSVFSASFLPNNILFEIKLYKERQFFSGKCSKTSFQNRFAVLGSKQEVTRNTIP